MGALSMPTVVDLALFCAGFLSWAISTLAAGGGSLLIVAAISFIIGGQMIAPVITLTSLMASPARMILLWDQIDWRLVRWYRPGAASGAASGAAVGGWAFSRAGAQWIELALALFLLSTLWQYRFGERERSFTMRLPWFVPVSFISGLISAMVGASGLLANPFYLNYGLVKEAMLATRAVNSLAIQVVKLISYGMFGMLTWPVVRHGLAAGTGAVVAIWLAHHWLQLLSSQRFRQLAVVVMVLGGLMIVWRQRHFLTAIVAG